MESMFLFVRLTPTTLPPNAWLSAANAAISYVNPKLMKAIGRVSNLEQPEEKNATLHT